MIVRWLELRALRRELAAHVHEAVFLETADMRVTGILLMVDRHFVRLLDIEDAHVTIPLREIVGFKTGPIVMEGYQIGRGEQLQLIERHRMRNRPPAPSLSQEEIDALAEVGESS